MLGGGYPTTVSGVLQAQPGVFGVRSTVLPEVGQTPGPPEPRHPQTPRPCTSPFPVFSMPIMGQIPQIPCLSFTEWHEHFENVTRLVGWDEHWKLAHLTSNLRETQRWHSIDHAMWTYAVTTINS